MFYKLKNELNLSQDGIITEKVKVENHNLYIGSDKIEKKENGWYINDFYQGEGAIFTYQINENEIVDNKILENVFEEEVANENTGNTL